MKLYFSFFILFLFSLSTYAQIDTKKKSIAIPAVKSNKDSLDTNLLLPSKPINNNKSINNINTPRVSTNLNMPKKEFSMFPSEEFGNPGELYEKQISKNIKVIKEELDLGTKGSKVDLYYGDIKTKSEFVYVQYRDYGEVDGDLIRVSVNDEIVELRVSLTGSFNGFKLYLKEGFNKIDFLALGEGYTLPNTAHFRIIDDQKKILASDLWALSIDVKATLIVIKE